MLPSCRRRFATVTQHAGKRRKVSGQTVEPGNDDTYRQHPQPTTSDNTDPNAASSTNRDPPTTRTTVGGIGDAAIILPTTSCITDTPSTYWRMLQEKCINVVETILCTRIFKDSFQEDKSILIYEDFLFAAVELFQLKVPDFVNEIPLQSSSKIEMRKHLVNTDKDKAQILNNLQIMLTRRKLQDKAREGPVLSNQKAVELYGHLLDMMKQPGAAQHCEAIYEGYKRAVKNFIQNKVQPVAYKHAGSADQYLCAFAKCIVAVRVFVKWTSMPLIYLERTYIKNTGSATLADAASTIWKETILDNMQDRVCNVLRDALAKEREDLFPIDVENNGFIDYTRMTAIATLMEAVH